MRDAIDLRGRLLLIHGNVRRLVAATLKETSIVGVVLWVCALAPGLAPALDSNPKAIRIGLLTELSGPSANVGNDCKRGYELARKSLFPNDKLGTMDVVFVYGDHRADAKTGVAEFRRLVDVEKAQAVVTNRSPVALAINPISKRYKIPLLTITGHPKVREQNPYAYEFWPLVEDEARALAVKAFNLKLVKVAIISSEDDWTLALRDHFTADWKSFGGVVVLDETVTPDEQGFQVLATKVHQTAPNLVFVNLRPGQVGSFVKRLREQHIQAQIMGNFYLRKKEEIASAGPAAMEGAILVESNFLQPQFLRLSEKYLGDGNISGITYSCYSALAALAQAMQTAPGFTEANWLITALDNLQVLTLPDEALRVENRAVRYKLVYRTIMKGAVFPINH